MHLSSSFLQNRNVLPPRAMSFGAKAISIEDWPLATTGLGRGLALVVSMKQGRELAEAVKQGRELKKAVLRKHDGAELVLPATHAILLMILYRAREPLLASQIDYKAEAGIAEAVWIQSQNLDALQKKVNTFAKEVVIQRGVRQNGRQRHYTYQFIH